METCNLKDSLISIRFVLLDKDVKLPSFETDGSVCADIRSNHYEILKSGEIKMIHTGFIMEIPNGFECEIRPRSGMALKNGITILNSPGTIDCDYRDEVCVILINHSSNEFEINKGDRIAQMAIRSVPNVEFVEVPKLTKTLRKGGFGSTGIK